MHPEKYALHTWHRVNSILKNRKNSADYLHVDQQWAFQCELHNEKYQSLKSSD